MQFGVIWLNSMEIIVFDVNRMADMVLLLLKDMVEIILVALHNSHLVQAVMAHNILVLVFHHNSVHNLLPHKAHKVHLVENVIVHKLKIPALLDHLVKKVSLVMMVLMAFLVSLAKMELMVNIHKLNDKNMVNASHAPLGLLDHKDLMVVLVHGGCGELEVNLVFLAVMEILDSLDPLDLKVQLGLLAKKDLPVNPVQMPPNLLDYLDLRVNKDLLVQLEISELPVKKAQLVNLVKKVNVGHLAKMDKTVTMVMLEKPENLVNLVLMQNIVHALLEALTAKLDLVVMAHKAVIVAVFKKHKFF
jgi:hypothetical protein